MDTSDHDAALISDLRRLLQRLNSLPEDTEARLTPLGERVRDHLGVDPADLPLVSERIRPHRLVDVDLALLALSGDDPDAALVGVGGGQERQHEDLTGLLRHRYSSFTAHGPIDYTTAATGPHSTRQVVAFGLRLFRFGGEPVAVLQRDAEPRYGRDDALVEVLATSAETSTALVADIRRLMTERSVMRGNIVSFGSSEFGQGLGRMTFLERPSVPASAVVLPEGVLPRIRDHVVGIAEHADALRAQGQHLKRGVLLYGPPGTGKTLTVRHLLHETPGTTAVLLQGASLGLISEAARLARAMTPAIVVLEDVDLVAAERGMFGAGDPLLFEVLDALDGLDGEADVAFVLTTNRADMLEPALAARPGRVDLAVEIPLPDAEARRGLFRMYSDGLPLSGAALDDAADRAAGVTASFAKELIRRAVLRAVLAGRDVTDDDLSGALDEMLAAAHGVSRALFGGEGTSPGAPGTVEHEHGGGFGWFASTGGVTFGTHAPQDPDYLDGSPPED